MFFFLTKKNDFVSTSCVSCHLSIGTESGMSWVGKQYVKSKAVVDALELVDRELQELNARGQQRIKRYRELTDCRKEVNRKKVEKDPSIHETLIRFHVGEDAVISSDEEKKTEKEEEKKEEEEEAESSSVSSDEEEEEEEEKAIVLTKVKAPMTKRTSVSTQKPSSLSSTPLSNSSTPTTSLSSSTSSTPNVQHKPVSTTKAMTPSTPNQVVPKKRKLDTETKLVVSERKRKEGELVFEYYTNPAALTYKEHVMMMKANSMKGMDSYYTHMLETMGEPITYENYFKTEDQKRKEREAADKKRVKEQARKDKKEDEAAYELMHEKAKHRLRLV